MIDSEKVLVLIPARGGSKGLPGKNIMELCGLPLLGWPIRAAKKSKYVDRVIVSTDDPQIANVAVSHGAEVPFIRPEELATDQSSSASVIEHTVSFLSGKGNTFTYLILLEPTSPLTEAEDVDKALLTLHSNRHVADSIVGVSKLEGTHPAFNVVIGEDGLIKPFLKLKFGSVYRRQDIEDVFYFEGSLYISDLSVFLKKLSFYHERTLPYVVPKWKAFEVDDMTDLICIEAIIKNMDRLKKYL